MQVGDTVKITTKNIFCKHHGNIGKITKIENNQYKVKRVGDPDEGYWYKSYEIILMEKAMKTWNEMTPEEKGLILLGQLEGKKIQFFEAGIQNWVDIEKPSWISHICYRVQPKPVVEKVQLATIRHGHTYNIEFNTLDGEVIQPSVKVTRLK